MNFCGQTAITTVFCSVMRVSLIPSSLWLPWLPRNITSLVANCDVFHRVSCHSALSFSKLSFVPGAMFVRANLGYIIHRWMPELLHQMQFFTWIGFLWPLCNHFQSRRFEKWEQLPLEPFFHAQDAGLLWYTSACLTLVMILMYCVIIVLAICEIFVSFHQNWKLLCQLCTCRVNQTFVFDFGPFLSFYCVGNTRIHPLCVTAWNKFSTTKMEII